MRRILGKDESGPQVKVCGLTVPAEAAACARLGADAIGLVFFPPSPRNVSLEQASAVSAALPADVARVGVFVDPDWDFLMEAIREGGLTGVQLHGAEPPDIVARLVSKGTVKVYKALFASKLPGMDQAPSYNPAAFLVECGQGVLPGGNAKTWDWGAAEPFARQYPTILAGGLSPDNAAEAIAAALPAAVDASSGLEAAPGRKDLAKVARFIEAVRHTSGLYAAVGRVINPVF